MHVIKSVDTHQDLEDIKGIVAYYEVEIHEI